MVEEGDLTLQDPLIAAGSPLVHPGFAMDRPPFLPQNSLVLLSSRVNRKTAERIGAGCTGSAGCCKDRGFRAGDCKPRPEIRSAGL